MSTLGNPALLATAATKIKLHPVAQVLVIVVPLGIVGWAASRVYKNFNDLKDGIKEGADKVATTIGLKEHEKVALLRKDLSMNSTFYSKVYNESVGNSRFVWSFFGKKAYDANTLKPALSFAAKQGVKIRDAVDGINDVGTVMGAIKTARSKSDVSLIAAAYRQKSITGKDLFSHLDSELTDGQMGKIYDFVITLPDAIKHRK